MAGLVTAERMEKMIDEMEKATGASGQNLVGVEAESGRIYGVSALLINRSLLWQVI